MGFAILISQFAVCSSSCSSLQGCTCNVKGPSSACPLPAKETQNLNFKTGPVYSLFSLMEAETEMFEEW